MARLVGHGRGGCGEAEEGCGKGGWDAADVGYGIDGFLLCKFFFFFFFCWSSFRFRFCYGFDLIFGFFFVGSWW